MEMMIEKKRLRFNPFWLSLCLHLLLLLGFSYFITMQPEDSKKLSHSPLPAYVFSNKVPPRTTRQTASRRSEIKTPTVKNAQIVPHSPHPELSFQKAKIATPEKSMLAASLKMLDQDQLKEITTSLQDNEPMLLIGEESAFSDPFLMLLGKALSAHFAYPKTAGELGIRGQVIIGLVLNPEGYFSQVHIIQSSHNHDLDAAALYAVNQAPVIKEIKRFISKPKHFSVGFIFR